MQDSGKNRRKYKLITETEEKVTHKGRNFALISGVACVIIVVVYLMVAAYPSRLFSEQRNNPTAAEQPVVASAHPELPPSPLKTSSEKIFASTTHVMTRLFAQMGKTYKVPSLQLFEDTISAYQCGQNLPASGPFYCAADKQVFLDLAFFRAVKATDTISGNNVQAYLIAHQVGHHIENLLGITKKINTALANADAVTAAKLNFKAELLADYYAGVWAHYTFKKELDNGSMAIFVGDATRISYSLAKNTESAVGDPYNYANLGDRSEAFYHGYLSGDLKKQDIFEPGELK